jgi:hypothetical protein
VESVRRRTGGCPPERPVNTDRPAGVRSASRGFAWRPRDSRIRFSGRKGIECLARSAGWAAAADACAGVLGGLDDLVGSNAARADSDALHPAAIDHRADRLQIRFEAPRAHIVSVAQMTTDHWNLPANRTLFGHRDRLSDFVRPAQRRRVVSAFRGEIARVRSNAAPCRRLLSCTRPPRHASESHFHWRWVRIRLLRAPLRVAMQHCCRHVGIRLDSAARQLCPFLIPRSHKSVSRVLSAARPDLRPQADESLTGGRRT